MKKPPYEDALSGPVSSISPAQAAEIDLLLRREPRGWAWYRGIKRMQCVQGVWSYWLHAPTWDGCRLECFNHPESLLAFLATQTDQEPLGGAM
ncbi:MAG TPA: hypothetical protein VNL71_14475 [Chloroflexota bacterium]|nr:hypothetical protein [Chloroflexota bacterium]